MNACASQIKAGQPTTACSPEVAAQAQAIATDSTTVADATKDAAHPNGQDIVYWIAPENGAAKSETEHVFHLCAAVVNPHCFCSISICLVMRMAFWA